MEEEIRRKQVTLLVYGEAERLAELALHAMKTGPAKNKSGLALAFMTNNDKTLKSYPALLRPFSPQLHLRSILGDDISLAHPCLPSIGSIFLFRIDLMTLSTTF